KTSSGREIVIPKEPDQVEFDQVAISRDGRAVGWLALYPNCCTSYPIPLKLFVRTGDTVHAFSGTGVPIWRWHFTAGDAHIAFAQETVHGGLGVHYELRDVATGRLIAEFTPEVGLDNQVLKGQPVPTWVGDLLAARWLRHPPASSPTHHVVATVAGPSSAA